MSILEEDILKGGFPQDSLPEEAIPQGGVIIGHVRLSYRTSSQRRFYYGILTG